MNALTGMEEWGLFLGLLGVEIGLVVALAWLVQCRLRRAGLRRSVWQAATLAVLTVTACELAGAREIWREGANTSRRGAPERQTLSERSRSDSVWLDESISANPSEREPGPVATAADGRLEGAAGNARKRDVFQFSEQDDAREESSGAANPRSPGFSSLLGVVWLVGFVALFAKMIGCHLLTWARLRHLPVNRSDRLNERVQRLCGRLGIRRPVALVVSSEFKVPFAFGFLRPLIGIPEDLDETHGQSQQEAILAHELTHIQNRDCFWYALAGLACALFWWHPGVWWLRRRLEDSCECAADESSVILEDGPETLAECLCRFGDLLAERRRSQGIGMGGRRYRSRLGHRVQHLLGLERRPWKCASGWRWLATGVLGSMLLAGGSIFLSTSIMPRAFADSPRPRLAFELAQQQAAPPPASDNPQPSTPAKPDLTAVRKAYEAGDLKQAKQEVGKLLAVYPADPWVNYYRVLLANVGRDAPVVRTKPDTAEQERIREKLRSIRLDEILFDQLPLKVILPFLSKETKGKDPDGKGINFLIQNAKSGSPNVLLLDAFGQPIQREPKKDFDNIRITIDPPLSDLRLVDALDAIVRGAEAPMHYIVEDYAVVFIAGEEVEPTYVYSQMFKILPDDFLRNLERMLAAMPSSRAGEDSDAAAARVKSSSTDDSSLDLAAKFGMVLNRIRRDLNSNPEQPPRIFYNQTSGTLRVRSNSEDVTLVGSLVELLDSRPSVVRIDTHWAEIPADVLKDVARTLFEDGKDIEGLLPGGSFSEVVSADLFQSTLQKLKVTDGVDILAAPRVTTLSGRQAQVLFINKVSVVTGRDAEKDSNGFKTEMMDFGPVFDVLPTVDPNGRSIYLTVTPRLREFLGYDNPDSFIRGSGRAKGATAEPEADTLPLPRIRERSITSSTILASGQTLALGLGSKFDRPAENARYLVVFITTSVSERAE